LGHPIWLANGPEPIFGIYLLDLFLAVPSLWLDKDFTSVARRKLYGQCGRYRPKDYGIEYRSLGNFWLQSPRLVSWIYDVCEFVVDQLDKGTDLWFFDEEVYFESDNESDAFTCKAYDAEALKRAVDTGDREAAQPFFELAQSLMTPDLRDRMNCLMGKSFDFYSEWKLA
jgi:hypothetical protein